MIPVIIPFYKHQDQLDRCIEHLNQQSLDVEVFIRDNNTDNVYFTKAVNEGIRKYLSQDCPYMLILNQDMYLEPSAIEEMVTFMDAHPECGIGSALEILKNHAQQYAAAGGMDLFPLGVRRIGPASQYQHNEQVPWASGSCLLLRKRMIQEIGLWDENFVFINSDGDYCLTARSRGWEVWRIGKALGHHELGASGRADDLNIELLKLRDVVYFSKKWLSGNLYRDLAYDAEKCTSEFVENTVQESLRKIPVLEALIASGRTMLKDIVNDPGAAPPEHQQDPARLCRKSPPSARERAVFSPGKDGEAGDIGFIVDGAGCSQAEKGPLEARATFPTEPCPSPVARTLRAATRHLQVGELDQADKCFREVLESEPNHPMALHAMSLIAYQQQDFNDADAFVTQAVSVDGQNALLYNTLGVVCEALDQHDRGISAYQEAVKINPRYAEAYMNLALAYQHQGQHNRAVAAGHQAIELEPAHAEHLQAIVGQDVSEPFVVSKE